VECDGRWIAHRPVAEWAADLSTRRNFIGLSIHAGLGEQFVILRYLGTKWLISGKGAQNRRMLGKNRLFRGRRTLSSDATGIRTTVKGIEFRANAFVTKTQQKYDSSSRND
jgi:hypothetical protein